MDILAYAAYTDTNIFLLVRADDVSEQTWPKKPATHPGLGLDDCYWAGHWPFCIAKCGYGYTKVKQDGCGDGHCCWAGKKTLCCVIPQQNLGDKSLEDNNDDGDH